MIDLQCIVRTEQSERFVQEWRAGQDKKKAVFFLGASIMQLPGIQLAREMGLTVHVADANSAAPGSEHADVFHHIDLRNAPKLAEAAMEVKTQHRLDAVLTIGTDFSASVAHVAEVCDLPGISPDAARNASHKDCMRTVLQDADLPVPRFVVISAENRSEAAGLAKHLHYPLVSKPSDNMGARGVREVRTPDELKHALTESFRHSGNGRVLLEEKIIGREYSLDSLISKGKFHPMGIARRTIDYLPYFIERGHDFPSDLSPEHEQEMFEVLRAAAAALDIHCGAAKGDIFLTEEGPMIGEIAARLSGGFMSGWTFPLHSGIHPAIGAILIALGEEPPQDFWIPQSALPVSERGIISIPGTIKTIVKGTPENKASEDSGSSCYQFLSVQPGDYKPFPSNNVEKCGNVICQGGPEMAEEVISTYLLPLNITTRAGLEKTLSDSFPSAFPEITREVQERKKSGMIHIVDEGQFFCNNFPVPDFIFHSPERDWNYRTVSASLSAMGLHLPEFSWNCQSVNDTWKISVKNINLLISLLRGGVQAALCYVELQLNITDPPESGLLPGVFG